MPDDRSSTKFLLLKFPCMLALVTMGVASLTTLAELSKYGAGDGRTIHCMDHLMWDSITLPIVGYLFWKHCK